MTAANPQYGWREMDGDFRSILPHAARCGTDAPAGSDGASGIPLAFLREDDKDLDDKPLAVNRTVRP